MTLGELEDALREAGRVSLVVNQDRATKKWGASARDVNGSGPMTTGHATLDAAVVAIVEVLKKVGANAATPTSRLAKMLRGDAP